MEGGWLFEPWPRIANESEEDGRGEAEIEEEEEFPEVARLRIAETFARAAREPPAEAEEAERALRHFARQESEQIAAFRRPFLQREMAPWTLTALGFLARCALRERTRAREMPELRELARAHLLASTRDPREMSQLEIEEAVHLLCMRWKEAEPSPELWEYVEALERRVAVLVRAEVESSEEFVVDCAARFASFFASREVFDDWRWGIAGKADLDEWDGPPLPIRGVRAWAIEEEKIVAGTTMAAVRKAVAHLGIRAGERERYARKHTNVVARNPLAIAQFCRPFFVVDQKWNAWERDVALLKLFDARCARERFDRWWAANVLLEESYFAAKRLLFVRDSPVILQCAGAFAVLSPAEGKIYRAPDAAVAIAAWCALAPAEFRLFHVIWDLSFVGALLARWRELEEE